MMLGLCYVILVIISVGNNGYVNAVDLTAVNGQRQVIETIQENATYNWTISAIRTFDVIIYELLVSPRIGYCDLKIAITEEAGSVESPLQEYTCINETARYYRSASSKISIKIKDSSLYFQENHSFRFRFNSINNATFNFTQEKTVNVTELPVYIWFPAVLKFNVTFESEKCIVVTGLTGTLSKVPDIAEYITAYTGVGGFVIGGSACGFGDNEAIDSKGTIFVLMRNQRNGIWIKAESSSICTRNVKNIILGNTTEVISSSYTGSMLCHWLVTTFDDNSVIDVNIETISSPVRGAVLSFAEGKPSALNVNVLGVWSSRGKQSYVTTKNTLQIIFTSLRIQSTAHFQVSLTVRPKVICGNRFLTAGPEVQYLTSPNYPGSYPNGMDCKWEIGVNKATSHPTQSIIVTVEMLDLFQVKSSDCGDYLNISKGDNGSPLLAHLCGDGSSTISLTGIQNGAQGKNIKTYQIFNDIAVIDFKSDNHFVARGFNISYYLYDTARSCNSTIVVHENPNYFHHKNLTRENLCDFTLVKPLSHSSYKYVIVAVVVEARLPDLDPVSRRCTNNRVDVYEGWKNDDGRRLGTFCGNITELAYLGEDKLFMRLRTTDQVYHNEGFLVRYYLGKTWDYRLRRKSQILYLTAQPDPQNFTSPNYPNQYGRMLNYIWKIKFNSHSSRVVVKVIDCDLTPSTRDTQADYVVVKNYDGKFHTQLGRFFGQEKPIYTSDGPDLEVQFISNRYEGNTGFKIQYYTIDLASEEDKSGTGLPLGQKVGLYVGISCGTLGVVIFAWCIIRRFKGKKTGPASATRPAQNLPGDVMYNGSNNIVSFDHYSHDLPIRPPTDCDPPSYDMVTRPPPSYDTLSIDTLPPGYDTLSVQAAPPSYSFSDRYKPPRTKT